MGTSPQTSYEEAPPEADPALMVGVKNAITYRNVVAGWDVTPGTPGEHEEEHLEDSKVFLLLA